MNDKIEAFVRMALEHQRNLFAFPEEYKKNNKVALEISRIADSLIFEDRNLEAFIRIAETHPELGWIVAGFVRPYLPDLSHEIYEKWYLSDKKNHWVGEFVLKHWHQDQQVIMKEKASEIEKFNSFSEQLRGV